MSITISMRSFRAFGDFSISVLPTESTSSIGRVPLRESMLTGYQQSFALQHLLSRQDITCFRILPVQLRKRKGRNDEWSLVDFSDFHKITSLVLCSFVNLPVSSTSLAKSAKRLRLLCATACSSSAGILSSHGAIRFFILLAAFSLSTPGYRAAGRVAQIPNERFLGRASPGRLSSHFCAQCYRPHPIFPH